MLYKAPHSTPKGTFTTQNGTLYPNGTAFETKRYTSDKTGTPMLYRRCPIHTQIVHRRYQYRIKQKVPHYIQMIPNSDQKVLASPSSKRHILKTLYYIQWSYRTFLSRHKNKTFYKSHYAAFLNERIQLARRSQNLSNENDIFYPSLWKTWTGFLYLQDRG